MCKTVLKVVSYSSEFQNETKFEPDISAFKAHISLLLSYYKNSKREKNALKGNTNPNFEKELHP